MRDSGLAIGCQPLGLGVVLLKSTQQNIVNFFINEITTPRVLALEENQFNDIQTALRLRMNDLA